MLGVSDGRADDRQVVGAGLELLQGLVAALRGEDFEKVRVAMVENAKRVFGI